MKLQIAKGIIPTLQDKRVKKITKISIQDYPGLEGVYELHVVFEDKSWFNMTFENRGIIQDQIDCFDRTFKKWLDTDGKEEIEGMTIFKD